MFRTAFITLFIFFSFEVPSQKEDHIWIYNFSNSFFTEPGDTWGCSLIDFNTLPPEVYEFQDLSLSFKETNASYCNDQGQLVYYTNGQEIRGLNHTPIINGDTINYGPRWDVFTDAIPEGQTTTMSLNLNQVDLLLDGLRQ